MDKLIVDINEIENNCSTYLKSNDDLESKKKLLDINSLNCDIKEVNAALKPYIEEARNSVQGIIKKSKTYIENIKSCCTEYEKNESKTENIDIGSIIEVIKSNPEYISNYKSDTLKDKIKLPSYKIYNAFGYDDDTHKYNPNASIRPLADGTFTVTSSFGPRWGSFHSGIDLGAPTGTRISSTMSGEVIRAEYFGGYGNCVDVKCGDTVTRYGHMSKINVKVGDKVSSGDKLGEVGSTGHSTGPHLHYEVRKNDKAIDPAPSLKLD